VCLKPVLLQGKPSI